MAEVLTKEPNSGDDSPLLVENDPDFPMVLYHPDGRTAVVASWVEHDTLMGDGLWARNPGLFGVVTAPDVAQLRRLPKVKTFQDQVQATHAPGGYESGALAHVLQQWDARISVLERALKNLTELMHSDSAKLVGYMGTLDVQKTEITALQAWVIEHATLPHDSGGAASTKDSARAFEAPEPERRGRK